MFLWSFSVQQTTYRIGNHVYYWVWLRPDRLMWRKQQQPTNGMKWACWKYRRHTEKRLNEGPRLQWKRNNENETKQSKLNPRERQHDIICTPKKIQNRKRPSGTSLRHLWYKKNRSEKNLPSLFHQNTVVVTQLRTDGVHCRESAGTRPVNLKVVPNECCLLGRSSWTN